MPDLKSLLHEAADVVPVVPAAVSVEDDVLRGRRALARSRRVRWAAAAPAGLAAVAAVALLVGSQQQAPPVAVPPATAVVPSQPVPSKPEPSRTVPSTGAGVVAARIQLVAYHGEQPAGYTIDRVPDGWEVQSVDEYDLVIAPVGAADQDPNSFEGKITVGRANPGEIEVERHQVRPVRVGDVLGKVFTFDDPVAPGPSWSGRRPAPDPGATQGLLLPVDHGRYLIFQFPPALHWDAATIADFAAGVHMTAKARAAAG